MLFDKIFFKKKTKKFSHFAITLIAKGDIAIENWLMEHLPSILDFYLQKAQIKLNDFDVNYGCYSCKSLLKLKEYLKKNENLECLFISGEEDFIYIHFNNNIDEKFRNEACLTVCLDMRYKDLLMDFFMNLDLGIWQYGYGRSLLANQTLTGDIKKRGLFSTWDEPLSENKIWDNFWWENGKNNILERGFIKNIYLVNIFNEQQAININLAYFKEKGIGKFYYSYDKIFWILDENHISNIKQSLVTNCFLVNKEY